MFGLALLAVSLSAAAAAGPERHAIVYTRGFGLPNEAVWIADVDGRRPRRLVAGWGGRLSPDSRWLAFQRCRPPRASCGGTLPDLWLTAVADGRPRLLSRWTHVVDWTRDARRLVAFRGKSLVTIARASADLTVVDRGRFLGVDVSPDGRSLVYAKLASEDACGGRSSLYVAPAGGGRPRKVASGRGHAFPVWGRAGIAFARISARECVARLWRIEPDGSRLRPILLRVPRRYWGGAVYGLRPYAWFPGGRRLLVGLRTEWGDYAAVLDARTRAVRRLGPQVDVLSRDGRFLLGTVAGAEYPYALEIVRIADGRRRRIAHGRICCAHWNR